jgi:hypothetical protein
MEKMRIASIYLASVLSLSSTPLLADQLILRCDSPKSALSFSVLIDPANRLVLDIGFGGNREGWRATACRHE